RVAGYESHLNVVAPGQTVRIAITGLPGVTEFDASYRKLAREQGTPGTRRVASLGTMRFEAGAETAVPVPESLEAGYHLLFLEGAGREIAVALHVRGPRPSARIAVVRPVFTEWSYHHVGFYP